MILTFENFVNEELNLSYETHDNFTEIVFEDRWFQYDSDDDIIYGYNNIPTDLSKGFTFKPNECVVYVDKKMIKYDINNPICIISYDLDTSTIKVFTDKSLDYLIKKYQIKMEDRYIIYTKDFKYEDGITYIPIYMTAFI